MRICECNTWMHWCLYFRCIHILLLSVFPAFLCFSVFMCAGTSGGCERFVRGADRFGEDREEDHASSSDAAEVWTLLRPASGGHRISSTLWSFLFLPIPCLLHLSNTARFNVSRRWWSSPSPLSFCHPSAVPTWRTGVTNGRLNTHTRKKVNTITHSFTQT